LVLESDEVNAQEWLRILVQLPLRIAAIYSSGGESIHSLVRVDAASKADWDTKAGRLEPIVAVLGADAKSITAVRLTRLPGCYREQDGPDTPELPFKAKRLVDEPLEFDALGNPIWTPAPGRSEALEVKWSGGSLQELLYLNPVPDVTPIFQRPTWVEAHRVWVSKTGQEMEVGW
jgi:hypothetical protein